ncbi:phage tail length tape measure family protein [Metapseudomonas furukawaii]|uniref:phage tail length tape measure family protein n=1 Tax=Metapseudomonas furukawaii TaxID=1149133 RepID=UPI00227C16FB|nr:phage tail length tape measure family protein [Pseudomonas furukawaii]WAG76976.1 phage tail length tape measure family protein [Pseudomonas furukawaii]
MLTSAVSKQSALEFVDKFKAHQNKHVLIYGEAAAKGVGEALSGVKNEASGLSSAASSSSQALKQVGSAGKSAAQSGAELVAALREQITLFGKSEDEVLRYQAAQLGVQKTIEPLVVQLRQLHDAQEAANRAMAEEATIMAAVAQSQSALSTAQYGFIEGLREQVALFGKTNLELVEFEAKMLGVSDAAEPLIQNLRELEAAQKRAEAAAREEAEAQRLAAQAKQSAQGQQSAFIASLREQVALQGKSAEEALEYKAAQLGVTQEAASYIAQIRSFKAAQDEANNAQGRGGLSAAQYQQAIRMLPAQITDITTSLASGMPVWLVAIQQGGQIKDSFGGIGNAARALASTVSPMSLAVGAAAAAALALGVAWRQGAQEAVEFNKAIILSGNQSGVTADQLGTMDDALQANRDYYAKLDRLREDSTNGQKAALADYLDSAKDVAGQTYDLFSNAFAGLEDALVEFVMTGKLSFADLANAIIADLVRIEIRKAVAFSLGGEGGKSGLGSLFSAGLSAASAWFGGGNGLSGSAAASSAAGASQAGYSMDLSNFIAGGRALGGPVAANELYQVGENNRPELLRQGGKNYLIPGDNGQVIPMRGQGGSSVAIGQMVFPSVTDRRTAEEASFIMQRRLGQFMAGTARAQ